MFKITQNPYAPPSKFRYRLSRFLLSRLFFVLSRFVLPIAIVVGIGYSILTSSSFLVFVGKTKTSVYESYANLPFFIVDEIVFENTTDLGEEEIRALIDFEEGKSIVKINRDELLENLLAVDAVGGAQIRYNYAGKMNVVVEPRTPVLLYFDGNDFSTIDHTGHRVHRLAQRSDRQDLFVIAGVGAGEQVAEAQEIFKVLTPLNERIRGLQRIGERRWDVVLTNNSVISLPAENPLGALKQVLREQILADVVNRDFEIYDLRNPEQPILRLNSSAQEELRRLREGSDQSA